VFAMNTIICKNCVLDSKTPGISIHPETGLCQFCEHFTPLSKDKKEEYRSRMDILLKSPPKQGKYDVIFALSGGIDSSYTLFRLKKGYPHLNILAVQFDNGFISKTALENARKFCDLTKSTYLCLTLDQNAMHDTFSRAARSRATSRRARWAAHRTGPRSARMVCACSRPAADRMCAARACRVGRRGAGSTYTCLVRACQQFGWGLSHACHSGWALDGARLHRLAEHRAPACGGALGADAAGSGAGIDR